MGSWLESVTLFTLKYLIANVGPSRIIFLSFATTTGNAWYDN
jgi:hypothetical protein